MKSLPHNYPVQARGAAGGVVTLSAEGVPELPSSAPVQFGGPGDAWSPESLLVAAAASCFVLTFRAVARAARLEWSQLECTVDGVLDREGGLMRFTRLHTHARLTVSRESSRALCQQTLEKAEHGCLVANSLLAARELTIEIVQP
jgi:peroxiredoxin-like protein